MVGIGPFTGDVVTTINTSSCVGCSHSTTNNEPTTQPTVFGYVCIRSAPPQCPLIQAN